MDLQALTLYLVKKLVVNSEAVSVELRKENDSSIIDVLVDEEDLGRVVGKGGKIINAIRTLVQASSYANSLGNVRINVSARN